MRCCLSVSEGRCVLPVPNGHAQRQVKTLLEQRGPRHDSGRVRLMIQAFIKGVYDAVLGCTNSESKELCEE